MGVPPVPGMCATIALHLAHTLSTDRSAILAWSCSPPSPPGEGDDIMDSDIIESAWILSRTPELPPPLTIDTALEQLSKRGVYISSFQQTLQWPSHKCNYF